MAKSGEDVNMLRVGKVSFGMYLCVFNLLMKQMYFQLQSPYSSLFCAFHSLSHFNTVSCRTAGLEVSEGRYAGRTGEEKLGSFSK